MLIVGSNVHLRKELEDPKLKGAERASPIGSTPSPIFQRVEIQAICNFLESMQRALSIRSLCDSTTVHYLEKIFAVWVPSDTRVASSAHGHIVLKANQNHKLINFFTKTTYSLTPSLSLSMQNATFHAASVQKIHFDCRDGFQMTI